jgi:hypothetical protein
MDWIISKDPADEKTFDGSFGAPVKWHPEQTNTEQECPEFFLRDWVFNWVGGHGSPDSLRILLAREAGSSQGHKKVLLGALLMR